MTIIRAVLRLPCGIWDQDRWRETRNAEAYPYHGNKSHAGNSPAQTSAVNVAQSQVV